MSRAPKPKLVVVQYPPSALGGFQAFTHNQLYNRYPVTEAGGPVETTTTQWQVPVQFAFCDLHLSNHLMVLDASLTGDPPVLKVGAWVMQSALYRGPHNPLYGLVGRVISINDPVAKAYFEDGIKPAGCETVTITFLIA